MAGIVEALNSYHSSAEVLGPLQELVSILQFHTQELRLRPLISPLMGLVSVEHKDVQLLALRALNLILDINIQNVEAIVGENSITGICSLPLEVADLDITEQAFKTLKFIAEKAPARVIDEGGIRNSLAFFSFFPMHLKRQALGLCADLASYVVSETHLQQVWAVLPTVCQAFTEADEAISVPAGDFLRRLFQSIQSVSSNTSKPRRPYGDAHSSNPASLSTIAHFVRRSLSTCILPICLCSFEDFAERTTPPQQEERKRVHTCWAVLKMALELDLGSIQQDPTLLMRLIDILKLYISWSNFMRQRPENPKHYMQEMLFPSLEAAIALFPSESEAKELMQSLKVKSVASQSEWLHDITLWLGTRFQFSEAESKNEPAEMMELESTTVQHPMTERKLGSQQGDEPNVRLLDWNCPACTYINTPERQACEMCETPNPFGSTIITTSAPCPWSGVQPEFNHFELGKPEDDNARIGITRRTKPRSKKVALRIAEYRERPGLVHIIANEFCPILFSYFAEESLSPSLRSKLLELILVLQLILPESLIQTGVNISAEDFSEGAEPGIGGKLIAGLRGMLEPLHSATALRDECTFNMCKRLLQVCNSFVTHEDPASQQSFRSLLMRHGIAEQVEQLCHVEEDMHAESSFRKGEPSSKDTNEETRKRVSEIANSAETLLCRILDPSNSGSTGKRSASKKSKGRGHKQSTELPSPRLLDSEALTSLRAISTSIQGINQILNDSYTTPTQHLCRQLSQQLSLFCDLVRSNESVTAYEVRVSGFCIAMAELLRLANFHLTQVLQDSSSFVKFLQSPWHDSRTCIPRCLHILFKTEDSSMIPVATLLARLLSSGVQVNSSLPLVLHGNSHSPLSSYPLLLQPLHFQIILEVEEHPEFPWTGRTLTISLQVEPVATVEEFLQILKKETQKLLQQRAEYEEKQYNSSQRRSNAVDETYPDTPVDSVNSSPSDSPRSRRKRVRDSLQESLRHPPSRRTSRLLPANTQNVGGATKIEEQNSERWERDADLSPSMAVPQSQQETNADQETPGSISGAAGGREAGLADESSMDVETTRIRESTTQNVPTRLGVGSRMYARFNTQVGPLWYIGTIQQVHGDGSVDVLFEDGDLRTGMSVSELHEQAPSGEAVHSSTSVSRRLAMHRLFGSTSDRRPRDHAEMQAFLSSIIRESSDDERLLSILTGEDVRGMGARQPSSPTRASASVRATLPALSRHNSHSRFAADMAPYSYSRRMLHEEGAGHEYRRGLGLGISDIRRSDSYLAYLHSDLRPHEHSHERNATSERREVPAKLYPDGLHDDDEEDEEDEDVYDRVAFELIHSESQLQMHGDMSMPPTVTGVNSRPMFEEEPPRQTRSSTRIAQAVKKNRLQELTHDDMHPHSHSYTPTRTDVKSNITEIMEEESLSRMTLPKEPKITPKHRVSSASGVPDSLGSPDRVRAMRVLDDDLGLGGATDEGQKLPIAVHPEDLFGMEQSSANRSRRPRDSVHDKEEDGMLTRAAKRATASSVSMSMPEPEPPSSSSAAIIQPKSEQPQTHTKPFGVDISNLNILAAEKSTSNYSRRYLNTHTQPFPVPSSNSRGTDDAICSFDIRCLPVGMCMAEVAQIGLFSSTESSNKRTLRIPDIQALLHRQTLLTESDWELLYRIRCKVAIHAEGKVVPPKANEAVPNLHSNPSCPLAEFSALLALGRLARMCELTKDLRGIIMKGPICTEFPDEASLTSVSAACCSAVVQKQLQKQLQDAFTSVCNMYPRWVMELCVNPDLQSVTPFETRLQIAHTIALGRSRRLHNAKIYVEECMSRILAENRSGSDVRRSVRDPQTHAAYIGGGMFITRIGDVERNKGMRLRRDKLLHDGYRLFKRLLNPFAASGPNSPTHTHPQTGGGSAASTAPSFAFSRPRSDRNLFGQSSPPRTRTTRISASESAPDQQPPTQAHVCVSVWPHMGQLDDLAEDSSTSTHRRSSSRTQTQGIESRREMISCFLSVDFAGEQGHGDGPTQEFFTLMCAELLGPACGYMWRTCNVNGFYPRRPRNDSNSNTSSADAGGEGPEGNAKRMFRTMGRCVAKALQDTRLLELPLNAAFCGAILDQARKHSLPTYLHGSGHTNPNPSEGVYSVPLLPGFAQVDPSLWRGLLALIMEGAQHVSRKDSFTDTCIIDEKYEVDPVFAASLNFTVPGEDDLELIPNGSNIQVDSLTLPDYVQRLAEHVLGLGFGLDGTVNSMVAGWQDFVPLSSVTCLKASEMQVLCHSDDETHWNEGEILASIVCNHGYTTTSPQVLHLASVMAELNQLQRKHFVQFITGASRLPLKGFRGLHPPLTVVCKKSVNAHERADGMLPSCSTCQVYLKLPEYSSRDILKTKLLQAITEGREYFALD